MGDFEKVGECLYRYVPSGTYYARLYVKGRQVWKSLGTKDRALAKRKLPAKRAELEKTNLGAGRATLAVMCDRYMATARQDKPKTLRRKTDIAARLKSDFPRGADVSIAKIDPSRVEAWLASYDFGAASYNLYLQFIGAVFRLAVHDGILAPPSPIAHLKAKRAAQPIRTTPTLEEFRAIVAEIRAQPFNADAKASADFVEFVGLAGLGQAEASSLTWGDVDFEKGRITTFRHKTSKGFIVPIFPQLLPLLKRMREQCGHTTSIESKVFGIKDAKNALAAACRRLKLPSYSHRSFRRMFITAAVERGIDPKAIAGWQGHQDGGRLILSTYSHLRPSHSDAMAQLMK